MRRSEAVDLLREGWEGLVAHRVRSVLSGLGILFGVAAVLGILSIGEGARREQDVLISRLGVLNFQLRNRDFSSDPQKLEEIRRVSPGLSLRDRDALRGELVRAVQVGAARDLKVSELVPRPRDATRVRLLGADPEWLAGSNLVLRQGRPLDARDEAESAPVCVLGAVARQELFGGERALGARIRVGDVWLTVVGLFDDGSGTRQVAGADTENRNGTVVVPLSTALRRLVSAPTEGASDPDLSEIQVTVDALGTVEGYAALAERIARRLHREAEDYEVVVPLRLLEQSRAQQRLFNLVMGLIAGISLLVGGIGIMNIMLASVLERTREIGVRLAVGARPRDIALLFLVESSLISLLGGLLGVVAGLLVSRAVAAGTGWATAVTPQAILLATVISTAEGVIFGFVPARRASRLPPMIAVRQT